MSATASTPDNRGRTGEGYECCVGCLSGVGLRSCAEYAETEPHFLEDYIMNSQLQK